MLIFSSIGKVVFSMFSNTGTRFDKNNGPLGNGEKEYLLKNSPDVTTFDSSFSQVAVKTA
jgi:hypothetical protein